MTNYPFELNKQDLVNLVISQHPNSMDECIALVKGGYMKFSGNQWNEEWDWIESTLLTKDDEELWALYTRLKKESDEFKRQYGI